MLKRSWLVQWSSCVLISCTAPPVECPPAVVVQDTPVSVLRVRNKVDLLFVVDNSRSMMPKQEELKARFPDFMKKLRAMAAEGTPAWYHIGVITTDLGAGPTTFSACRTGGDGGKLQVLGKAAASTCVAVGKNLDTREAARFIDYDQLMNRDNLPPGQDLDHTFQCMASVGDDGCGFEHQLEAAMRALKDPIDENKGFLREDAVLVVVFVTDEDDCSAPQTTDLFDAGKYGLQQSFRCTQYGLQFGVPPTTPLPGEEATLTDVAPAPDGKLFGVERYINFFSKPLSKGGVKLNPDRDVVLVGIDGPVSKIDGRASVHIKVESPCSQGGAASCPVLDHLPCRGDWIADPAIRMSAVINSTKNRVERSICDTSYTDSMEKIAELINNTLQVTCLPAPIERSKTNPSQPDCVAELRQDTTSGIEITQVAWCGSGARTTLPCWEEDDSKLEKCDPVKDPTTGADIYPHIKICYEETCDPVRGLSLVPKNTDTQVFCATRAIQRESATPLEPGTCK